MVKSAQQAFGKGKGSFNTIVPLSQLATPTLSCEMPPKTFSPSAVSLTDFFIEQLDDAPAGKPESSTVGCCAGLRLFAYCPSECLARELLFVYKR